MDYNKPIVFIDLSYYIFYRWYAIYNWYKLSQQKEPDVENIFEDIIFIEKFNKLFWETITKFIKKHKLIKPNIIFARDCSRNNIWRNTFHSAYKGNREDKLKNFNNKIFPHVYDNILPNLIENFNNNELKNITCINVFSVNNAEADDIIGILKQKIRKEYPELKIYIITNDHDYLQLFDDNTEIINLKGYDLRKKSKGKGEIDLLLKIIIGDVSDNINSIFGKKVTENFAMKYVNDEELLNKYLQENPEAKIKFDENKKLIDFTFIPEEIKINIEKLITESH
jgi:5'-3' exonuclease